MHYGLAYSPDGRFVAATTHQPPVIVWNIETGRVALTIDAAASIVKNLAYSHDGKWLIGGGGDLVRSEPGEINVWDARTGALRFRMLGHTEAIFAVAPTPDGRRLASASHDHTVKIWDMATGRVALTLHGHRDTVRSVAFDPTGNRLATAAEDGTIKLWDATPRSADEQPCQVRTLPGASVPVFGVAFHPDGARVTAVADSGTLHTWDFATGRELIDAAIFNVPQIYSLAISRDGCLLATATKDGKASLYDLKKRVLTKTLTGHPPGPVKALAFSPDGRHLALGHWHRTIWVWEVASGKLAFRLDGHEDAILSVAYSPDGRLLASGGRDRSVRVWDAHNGKLLMLLVGHTSIVNSVAFSVDNHTLASASEDGTIRIWDTSTRKLIRTLEGHTSAVRGVAFSPNGRQIASCGNDWTVRLWDAQHGDLIVVLHGHEDRVHGVAFRCDGTALASCSSDGTVRLWSIWQLRWPRTNPKLDINLPAFPVWLL